MAICFRVEKSSDLSKIFAAHDLHSSILSDLFGRVLTPEDDYYTSPWAFLPVMMEDDDDDGDGDGDGDGGDDGIGGGGVGGGFIVMTCRVPWLHGHGKHHPIKQNNNNNNNKDGCGNNEWQHQYFQRAREMMREYNNTLPIPYIEMGPERMQHHLMLDENDIYTFTKDGCYPDTNDISQALEDRAVEVTCGAMGWKVPKHWRRERERERAALFADVFDLAGYDMANNKNNNDDNDNDNKKSRNERMMMMGSSSATKRKYSSSSSTTVMESPRPYSSSSSTTVEPPRSKFAALISSPRYEGNHQQHEQHEEKKDSLSLDHHPDHDLSDGEGEQEMDRNSIVIDNVDPYSTLIIPPPSSIYEGWKQHQQHQQQYIHQQQQHGEEEEDGILHPETSSSSSHVDRYERVERKHHDTFYDDDAKNNISDENDPMDETREEGRIEI